VFVALADTVQRFNIPQHEFSDLLTAFRQDQTVTCYEKFEDLLGYCLNSANPVGHLVLYLCGYRDAERQKLSDYTCTALQLANFWQDVSVDYAKGRIYLPLESLHRFGVSEEDLANNRNTPAFCSMMQFEVQRARDWFKRGLPLIGKVDKELAIDLELFSRGGQEILNAIERQGFAVLGRRPAISKFRKLALVARAALGKLQRNCSYLGAQLLLRIPGAAAREAECSMRDLRVHAALRRFVGRCQFAPPRAARQAGSLA
jgi:squalene synthase HpnC